MHRLFNTLSRILLVAAVCLSLTAVSSSADTIRINCPKTSRYLYIWASDVARKAADSLVVVDFDEDSRNYGKVIRVVPLPAPGNTGNEPHHMHLSADKRILGCGGLLSLLKGQNGIFFFDT